MREICAVFLIYFACQMVSGVEKTFNPGKRGKACMCVCVLCAHSHTCVFVCVSCKYVCICTFGEEHDFRLGSYMSFPLLL